MNALQRADRAILRSRSCGWARLPTPSPPQHTVDGAHAQGRPRAILYGLFAVVAGAWLGVTYGRLLLGD